jgi:hypothetical protein
VNFPFIKFPSTPHIIIPPGLKIRDDKLLDDHFRNELLHQPIILEEKIDGANIGIWFDPAGQLYLQNRGQILTLASSVPSQFGPLKAWIASRQFHFFQILSSRYILFGEWCFAKHTVFYNRLPDYFLGFDLYDREQACFLAQSRRDQFMRALEVATVPGLFAGILGSLEQLLQYLGPSRVGSDTMEGLYIRLDTTLCLAIRAKYVRPNFLQTDEIHWSQRKLEKNRLITE